MKALTKEKKEKGNVLTNLELVNLKNVSLLQSKGLRRKTTKVDKQKLLEEKEYQMNLQHLQTQLEMAQKHWKNLNLASVKKRIEDYEQMLEYYTLTRMKNKTKDFEIEYEEWWEVAEEYITNELEKNLTQHKVDERITRYKLESYQKNFPNFICGSPTSTEVSSQHEEIEIRPSRTV